MSEWYSGNTSGKRHGIGGQMISHPDPNPEWLATVRHRYLFDAEFHAAVEVMVQERLVHQLKEVQERYDAEIERLQQANTGLRRIIEDGCA